MLEGEATSGGFHGWPSLQKPGGSPTNGANGQHIETQRASGQHAGNDRIAACAATPEPLQQTVNTNGRSGGGV